jgi:type I pullulanase
MKKKMIAIALLSLSLGLAACQNHAQASSSPASSSSNGAAVSSEGGSSSGANASSEENSSGSLSSSSEESSSEDTSGYFKGLVKVYYHNDSADYATKRIWAWAVGVDGAEYSFDNQASPDSYGLYKVFDLSAEPWANKKLVSFSFIIKNAGSWSGQSTDTNCTLSDYTPVTEEGKSVITIYGADAGDGSIATYAKKEDALGDRLLSADFTDWRTIKCVGTGFDDGRDKSLIGKASSYSLYAFDKEYFKLEDDERRKVKENYKIQADAATMQSEGSGSDLVNYFVVSLSTDATPSLSYVVEAVFISDLAKTKAMTASFVKLYDDSKFVSDYTYDGDDLGQSVDSEGHFVFKVWAPTASRVVLNIYYTGTPSNLSPNGDSPFNNSHRPLDMTLGEHGVWTYTSKAADYTNCFYTFTVTNSLGTNECADPYAKSAGINGIRSAILKPSQYAEGGDITPTGFKASIDSLATSCPVSALNDLSIYEVHIRDFTADSSWNGTAIPGTYNAFAESGTSYGGKTSEGADVTVSTGFDSLADLGVKAVQLLPVFDQDNDERREVMGTDGVLKSVTPGYNWGYNPQNYDCVEGVYSSDPYSAYVKMKEYKSLIQKLADHSMRTIMDVVYNHMSSVSSNSFTKLMPKYFFRTNAEGYYTDGTGVGNEIASERLMARRFIVDSVKWWANEYGIKGFRFDLMGCLDTTTMRAVRDALYAIDPSIVCYGEGWTGGSSSLNETLQSTTGNVYANLYDQGKGAVGCFNDHGRDGLKGNTPYGSVAPDYGFISKGETDLKNSKDLLWQAYCAYLGENRNQGANPEQTVDYVSCHDNYTLYDQLNYCFKGGVGADSDSSDAMNASVALTAYTMMGQGAAFLQGGEELFRQKLMKSDDAYYSKIADNDALSLEDGTKLVRNSYMYGDAVNSFKWDRKATFNKYYLKYQKACELRTTYANLVSYNKSEVDSMISPWGELGDKLWTCVAINNKTANGTYYVMLGGECSGTYTDVPFGSETIKTLFSSNDAHTAGESFQPQNGVLGIGKWEFCLFEKVA